jgi:hypothetical protein
MLARRRECAPILASKAPRASDNSAARHLQAHTAKQNQTSARTGLQLPIGAIVRPYETRPVEDRYSAAFALDEAALLQLIHGDGHARMLGWSLSALP